MLKILGGVFSMVALIMGQIIGWQMVSQYLPQYTAMWIVTTVFIWLGIVFTALGNKE